MIDTHLHLLYPEKLGYEWTADLPGLQCRFSLEDYWKAVPKESVHGALFMEVDVDEGQEVRETEWIRTLADQPGSGILGVVAKCRPELDGFADRLDALANPMLRGIRRVLHTQPDALSQTDLFRRNVGILGERNLTFDLCVTQKQLSVGLDLVRSCPGTTFVLDHCGVPDIAGNGGSGGEGFEAWSRGIRTLADQPNVVCKLSGLLLYAGEEERSAEGLLPYAREVFDAFGTDGVVWGGDWPVCTLAVPLADWVDVTRTILERCGLDRDEKKAVFEGNACRVYRLGSGL